MKNDIILPDEYDRIHLDLAPFFALPRSEMHKRVAEVQNLPETYTLNIRRGRVTIEVGDLEYSIVSADFRFSQITDEGGLAWGGTWPRAVDSAA
jgi:beta-1,2-xylosyltransferase